MDMLSESQIKQVESIKDLVGSHMFKTWDEIAYDDDFVESVEFLSKRKICLLLMDRLFRSIGLKPFSGFSKVEIEGRSCINNNFDSYELATNIVDFYSHYMYQLGYDYTEIEISEVLAMLQSETDVCEIAEDYEVEVDYIERIQENTDDIEWMQEACLYVWTNEQVKAFIRDYDLALYPEIRYLMDSVMEPVRTAYDAFVIKKRKKGMFEYAYLLFEDGNEPNVGLTGLDYYLTDMMDAVLLHDKIQKLRAKEHSLNQNTRGASV